MSLDFASSCETQNTVDAKRSETLPVPFGNALLARVHFLVLVMSRCLLHSN